MSHLVKGPAHMYRHILRCSQLGVVNEGSSDVVHLVDMLRNVGFRGTRRSMWHSCIYSYVQWARYFQRAPCYSHYIPNPIASTLNNIASKISKCQVQNELCGAALPWNHSSDGRQLHKMGYSGWKHWSSGALCITCAAGTVQESRDEKYKAAAASATPRLMTVMLVNLWAGEAP